LYRKKIILDREKEAEKAAETETAAETEIAAEPYVNFYDIYNTGKKANFSDENLYRKKIILDREKEAEKAAEAERNLLKKFAFSQDLSYMQAMVADGTIKDVNKPYNGYDRTALWYQCYHRNNKGYLERVRFLLGCHPPANPNIQDRLGCTCLHWAIYNSYGGDDPDLVRLLLENGADRSIKNISGDTALDLAKRNKFNNSVEVLENYFPLLNSNGNRDQANIDYEEEKVCIRRDKP
jgi:ankyrin repeat protein